MNSTVYVNSTIYVNSALYVVKTVYVNSSVYVYNAVYVYSAPLREQFLTPKNTTNSSDTTVRKLVAEAGLQLK